MGTRILWDRYEIALLIDACHNYNQGKISRKDAIAYVSNTLRKRAIENGLTIDKIFRNENGISMQFTIMNGLLHHQKSGLHNASRLFIEMVELYEKDRDRFEKILKEEIHVKSKKIGQNQEVINKIKCNEVSRQKLLNLDAYKDIICEKYQKGFHIESRLEIKRFRHFWKEKYGNELLENDERIRDNIRKITIQYESIVYYPDTMITDELKQKLLSHIILCFKEGKKNIYYSALYKKFEIELQEKHINNSNMLKSCLKYINNGEYVIQRDYLAESKGKGIDISEEVKEYLITCGIPVTVEKIFTDLSHLPENKIRLVLSGNNSNEFIWNKKGEYFHSDIMEVSKEELEKIENLLEKTIKEKKYIGTNEFVKIIGDHYPSIREGYSNLTDTGFSSALAYKLKDKFAFNGKIISSLDENLTMKSIFAEYAKSKDKFSLNELNALRKELNSIIYFDSIYENSLRINQTEFVSKKNANFNIEAIDTAIDRFCIGDYISIGQIQQFGSFPYVGFPWNSFLLEHYVADFSKKYQLLHVGYNAGVATGAIVRKTAGYKDFDDLVVHILRDNNISSDKNKALEYLCNHGFIARKRYSRIDGLLEKVAVLRKQEG